jgi:uncharacterized protein
MNHDAVVRDWQRNSGEHDDENYEFLRSMKFRNYGFKPDKLAAKLHEQAFQIVDCTRCANCCKTMNIVFTDEDISRIANHLCMTEEELIATHLELDSVDSSYKTRQSPCPFLGQDDRCTIYGVRPAVCREYPHTDKPGFTFRAMGVADNALVCPAVFWIVEQMKQRAAGNVPK